MPPQTLVWPQENCQKLIQETLKSATTVGNQCKGILVPEDFNSKTVSIPERSQIRGM